ncbi:hypothetical protein UlMin_013746 [Ulmus minor]
MGTCDFSSFNWDLNNSHGYGIGNAEMGTFSEQVNDDVLARLPEDPFEMDTKSTFTSVSDFFQGFESGSSSSAADKIDDGGAFAEFNWVLNSVLEFDDIQIQYKKGHGFGVEDGFVLDGNGDDFLSFNISNNGAKQVLDCNSQEGEPHEALFLALPYLGIKDLLSVEGVCRSLRDIVRNDNLLWRDIFIDRRLITDDTLLKLTNRAQGTLECLSLLYCSKITDGGLKLVLDSNPRLKKLSVPGCNNLSAKGILNNLRAFKSGGTSGIKQLRVTGLNGITEQQFEELKLLLGGADSCVQLIANKPRIYCGRQTWDSYVFSDDDRAINVEGCPRCQMFRPVFDCPAESCKKKHQAAQKCRACILCIARCFNCGHCINDLNGEVTFIWEMLCMDCFKHLLNCPEIPGETSVSSKPIEYSFSILC